MTLLVLVLVLSVLAPLLVRELRSDGYGRRPVPRSHPPERLSPR